MRQQVEECGNNQPEEQSGQQLPARIAGQAGDPAGFGFDLTVGFFFQIANLVQQRIHAALKFSVGLADILALLQLSQQCVALLLVIVEVALESSQLLRVD